MSFGNGFISAFQGLKKIEILKATRKLQRQQKKKLEKDKALWEELEKKVSSDEFKLLEESKQLSRIEENMKSDLECPECQSPFYGVRAGEIEFCGCNKCRSVWLNYEQALQLENAKEIIPTHKRCRKSEYVCPECHEDLIECVYKIPGNLLVDICPNQCGIYFEQGEVARAICLNNKIAKGQF